MGGVGGGCVGSRDKIFAQCLLVLVCLHIITDRDSIGQDGA